MMKRTCGGGGVLTAIPSWEAPEVVAWGPTAEDSTYIAAKEHVDLSHKMADVEHALAQEFAAQQHAEFLKIRARA